MKRIATILVLIAGLAFAASAPAASAAPVKECGNFVQRHYGQPGSWYWSYRYSLLYSPVRNLTTRSVSCTDARWFSIRESVLGEASYHGFACRWHYWTGTRYDPQYDVRCTRGGQIIHWQGSGFTLV